MSQSVFVHGSEHYYYIVYNDDYINYHDTGGPSLICITLYYFIYAYMTASTISTSYDTSKHDS